MEEELKQALQVAVTALTRIMAGADGPAYYIAKAALEELETFPVWKPHTGT